MLSTVRLRCAYGEAGVWPRDNLDGPACSKPTPVARGQNAPLLVFFMVWARWQSRVPSARPKKGSPDGPTLTPTLQKKIGGGRIRVNDHGSAARERCVSRCDSSDRRWPTAANLWVDCAIGSQFC